MSVVSGQQQAFCTTIGLTAVTFAPGEVDGAERNLQGATESSGGPQRTKKAIVAVDSAERYVECPCPDELIRVPNLEPPVGMDLVRCSSRQIYHGRLLTRGEHSGER